MLRPLLAGMRAGRRPICRLVRPDYRCGYVLRRYDGAPARGAPCLARGESGHLRVADHPWRERRSADAVVRVIRRAAERAAARPPRPSQRRSDAHSRST